MSETGVYARARDRNGFEGGGDDGDPFEAVAALFESVFARLDKIEGSRSGLHGRDGRDGDPGRGIVGAKIDAAGHLILTFSDNTEQNVGRVAAEPAPAPQTLVFERDADGKITRSVLR